MEGQLLRQDILSGEYVIVSPSRGHRPGVSSTDDAHSDSLGPERCPFCPGREDQIPPIRYEQAGEDGGLWRTRVFANKYPALDEGAAGAMAFDGLYRIQSGRGVHEVIVETPLHTEDFHVLDPQNLEAVLRTYAARVSFHRAENPDLHITLFKNHGRKAGATLRHPHSQLIATPVVPVSVRRREARMRRYYHRRRACMVCSIVRHEIGHGERIVWADENVVAFVPFAASVAHEIMIVPRRHHADLSDAGDSDYVSSARALSVVTRALDRVLGSHAFNLLLCLPSNRVLGAPYAHWFMRILPRYGVDAGFETSTGMRINAMWPETSALLLREALPHVQAA